MAPPRIAPPPHQLVVGVRCSVDEAAARTVAALLAHDLALLDDVDASALLGAPQRALAPTRHILAFNARYLERILSTDPNAVVDVPLKFAIAPAVAGATVRCTDPSVTFGPYLGLESLAAEISAVCHAVLRAVAREPRGLGPALASTTAGEGRAPSAA